MDVGTACCIPCWHSNLKKFVLFSDYDFFFRGTNFHFQVMQQPSDNQHCIYNDAFTFNEMKVINFHEHSLLHFHGRFDDIFENLVSHRKKFFSVITIFKIYGFSTMISYILGWYENGIGKVLQKQYWIRESN